MNSEQMKEVEWFYRGHTPQKTQFEMVENPPKKDFQTVRLMGFKSSLVEHGWSLMQVFFLLMLTKVDRMEWWSFGIFSPMIFLTRDIYIYLLHFDKFSLNSNILSS